MDPGLVTQGEWPVFWLFAVLHAFAGTGVALALARTAPRSHHGLRGAAGVALGLTMWSVTVLALAALPQPVAYQPAWLLAAAAAPTTTAWLALYPPRRAGSLRVHLGWRLCGALLMALGLLAAPLFTIEAMGWHPPARWVPGPLLHGGGMALAAASLMLFLQSSLGTARQRVPLRILVGTLPLAVLLLGVEATTLGAIELAPGAEPLPSWAVPGDSVVLLALVGVPVLLTVLAFAARGESRLAAQLDRTRDDLVQAATTDPLTHLPNRGRFETLLHGEAMRADREHRRLAVLCINLDGLKHFNESFGPAVGDALLCGVADRLRRLAGPVDLLARSSGDEFLLMLASRPDREAAARAASEIVAALARTLMLDGREVTPSASIGIAMYPEDGSMAALLPRAAAAMRHAKRNGPGSYGFFDPQLLEGVRDNVDLLRDLRHAIERHELVLHYQPKVDAASGETTGVEALLRWQHPKRGMVQPVQFIALAERAGMINTLGNWVIDEACRQMQAWRREGVRLPVSINLSVHQLRQADLVDRIRAALVRHQIEPMQLICEITESAAMDDTGATLALVQELAGAGVRIAIDDFGTGYSSLTYLRRLPATELKIDRSFVKDLQTSIDARAIVDAVIKLAHALGLRVVAEGVETEAQRTLLRHLGCDELQGYLFAKPMAARILQTWAADGPPRGALPAPHHAPQARPSNGTTLASITADTVRGVRLSPQQGIEARFVQPPA